MTPNFGESFDQAAALPESRLSAIRAAASQSGLSSREEAEFLFTLDRLGHICGHECFATLVRAMRDFVVWEQRPTGYVTENDVDWLMGMIGDRPTAFGRAVVFAIVQEAEQAPARLGELAMRAAVGRCLLV